MMESFEVKDYFSKADNNCGCSQAQISSLREAAAELDDAQDVAGALTLEETQRRAERQFEDPPAKAAQAFYGGGDGDSGSGSDNGADSGSGEATASETDDDDDSDKGTQKSGRSGGEVQRRSVPDAGSRASSAEPARSPAPKKLKTDSKLTGASASGGDSASCSASPLAPLRKRLEDIRNGAFDEMTGRILQRLIKDMASEQTAAMKFKSNDAEEVERVKDACGLLGKLLNVLKVSSKANSTISDWCVRVGKEHQQQIAIIKAVESHRHEEDRVLL